MRWLPHREKGYIPNMTDQPTPNPDHMESTRRGEDFADEPTETQGPTNRPVGKVEGDPMSETSGASA